MASSDKQKLVISTTDEELNILLGKYFEFERVEKHLQHIRKLLQENDLYTLEKLIKKRLTFGTAGIRGSMGAGFGQMNDLVIIQTSQGLASYLLELKREDCINRGIIIGNDARHNSDRFARLTALAFLQQGIPVYFCQHIVPTPLISFGVKFFNACAGIVITASHNPKTDNGYKVYWSNGAQILTPHDTEIQRHIMKSENQKPWPMAWQEDLLSSYLKESSQSQLPTGWKLHKVYDELKTGYFNYIKSIIYNSEQNRSSKISIAYTTMHGVGHEFLTKALKIAGFENAVPVESQKDPNPDFPTVKFPNPEEAGALDLAFETAANNESNLILANDPDADRCAAALYNPQNGAKRVLNGNEIGSLLGWWLMHSFMLKRNPGVDLDQKRQQFSSAAADTLTKTDKLADCYMISTAVSSKFLSSMAKVEGFNFIETLTGFKYMGNIADKLIHEQEKQVLFAYEEAIGYMVDSRILDKDGISAAIQLAQCAAYISRNFNRTLEQHLEWLYAVYGYHYNLNSYYICADAKIIQQIFHSIQAEYPKSFGDEFKVTRIRDLNNNYDSGTADHKCTLPTSSSSFMVTFTINDNITLTLRTSGTEPKIKYYSEIVKTMQASENQKDFSIDETQRIAKSDAQKELAKLVGLFIAHCLKPERYNLEPASQ